MASDSTKDATTSLSHPEYTTNIGPKDVILGRGIAANNHPGNVNFRTVIKSRKMEYSSSCRRQLKADISKEIMSSFKDDGVRFVREIKSNNEALQLGIPFPQRSKVWLIVDDDMIIRKIKQALREEETSSKKRKDPPEIEPAGQGFKGLVVENSPTTPSSTESTENHQVYQIKSSDLVLGTYNNLNQNSNKIPTPLNKALSAGKFVEMQSHSTNPASNNLGPINTNRPLYGSLSKQIDNGNTSQKFSHQSNSDVVQALIQHLTNSGKQATNIHQSSANNIPAAESISSTATSSIFNQSIDLPSLLLGATTSTNALPFLPDTSSVARSHYEPSFPPLSSLDIPRLFSVQNQNAAQPCFRSFPSTNLGLLSAHSSSSRTNQGLVRTLDRGTDIPNGQQMNEMKMIDPQLFSLTRRINNATYQADSLQNVSGVDMNILLQQILTQQLTVPIGDTKQPVTAYQNLRNEQGIRERLDLNSSHPPSPFPSRDINLRDSMTRLSSGATAHDYNKDNNNKNNNNDNEDEDDRKPPPKST